MDLGYDRINDFLNKRLSDREMEAMERHLKENSLDAEMVANVADALQQGKSIEELKQLNNWFDQGIKQTTRKKKTGGGIRIRVAAAAVLLIASGLWLTMGGKPTAYELYESHYAPYRDMVTTRGQYAHDEAMKLYNHGDFKQAEIAFAKVVKNPESMSVFRLYYSICLFENGKNQEATASLKLLLASTDDAAVQEPAHWYLAMIYLSDEQVESARKELTLLLNYSPYYANKAKELLNDL